MHAYTNAPGGECVHACLAAAAGRRGAGGAGAAIADGCRHVGAGGGGRGDGQGSKTGQQVHALSETHLNARQRRVPLCERALQLRAQLCNLSAASGGKVGPEIIASGPGLLSTAEPSRPTARLGASATVVRYALPPCIVGLAGLGHRPRDFLVCGNVRGTGVGVHRVSLASELHSYN